MIEKQPDKQSEKEGFVNALAREAAGSVHNRFNDNWDTFLFGPPPEPEAPEQTFRSLFQLFKNVLRPFKQAIKQSYGASKELGRYIQKRLNPVAFYRREAVKFSTLDPLYRQLKNSSSKNLLLKLFAYRILGHEKVKLPRNSPAYWQGIEKLRTFDTGKEPLPTVNFKDLKLNCLNLRPIGYDLEVYSEPITSACTFVQKQYEYRSADVHCKAVPGDFVIDAGACWGETSLYFAHEVGKEGMVYSFEFIPSSLQTLKTNIKTNPSFAERISVVEHPIWSKSDLPLYYDDRGPASRVSPQLELHGVQFKEENTVTTLSIDDLVERRNIPKIDFIKMDIEGAELEALKGAEKTIKKFRPKLAISVYHQPSDITTIPDYIQSLGCDYEFFLDHHTIHLWETVLFAVPHGKEGNKKVSLSFSA